MTGFSGKVTWDTSRPDGKKFKVYDNRRLKALGLDCPTSLREGLSRTIRWFGENYSQGTVRL